MDVKPLKEQTRAEMLITLALKNYNQDLIANAEHFLHLVQAMYPCEIAEELLKIIQKSKVIITRQEESSTEVVLKEITSELDNVFEKDEEMETEEGTHNPELLFPSKLAHKDMEIMPGNQAISDQNKAKKIQFELEAVPEKDEVMETVEGTKGMDNPELLFQSQQALRDMGTMPENEAIGDQNKGKEIQSEREVVLEKDDCVLLQIETVDKIKNTHNPEQLFQSVHTQKDSEIWLENEVMSIQNIPEQISDIDPSDVSNKSMSEPSPTSSNHLIDKITETAKCLETANQACNNRAFNTYERLMSKGKQMKQQLDIERNFINVCPSKSKENIRATNIELEKPVNSNVPNNEPKSESPKKHLESIIYNSIKVAEMHLDAPKSAVNAEKLKKAEKMLPKYVKVHKRKQATDLQEQIIGIKKLKCGHPKHLTENIHKKGSNKEHYETVIKGGLADTTDKLSLKEAQRKEPKNNKDEVKQLLTEVVKALENRDYFMAQNAIRQAQHLQPNHIIDLVKKQVQNEEKMKNESAHLPTNVNHLMTTEYAYNYLTVALKAFHARDFANAISFCKLAESWHESMDSRDLYITCIKKKLRYKGSELTGDKKYIKNAEVYYKKGDFSRSEKYLLCADSSNLYVTELLKLVRAKKCLNQC